MTQTGSTLQLPYMRAGLGRTNNYISNLHISTVIGNKKKLNSYEWSPIIPNSDILVIPPAIDLTNTGNNVGGKWFL